jgi:hypothetical protein
MIDVDIQIDRASQRKMEETLRKFATATGKTVEDGIQNIARIGAKQLAIKVQPYGITGKAKTMLHGIVAKQAHRAISNANVTGIEGSAAAVHLKARQRGRVPREIQTKGQFKRKPIPITERNAHVDRQVKKIGRAKAAWIEAGEKINGGAIKVQKWLRSVIGGGYGAAIKRGNGMGYSVELRNSTPYIDKIQFTQDTAAAVISAMKAGFKQMKIATEKEIEKANRAL